MSDTPNNGGVLIPVGPGRLILAGPNDPRGWLTSLPDTADGWKDRINAVNCTDVSMDDCDEHLMEVRDYVVCWREQVDPRTGEVKEFSSLVLIGVDGHTLATSSAVAAHHFARVWDAVERGKLPLPVMIRVHKRQGTSGRAPYHAIQVV